MSVVIETTIGDFTVDLYLKERPNTCLNFLKLCRIKYYNLCIFHKVERNFIAQTGDPTSTGRGGESVFSRLYGDQATYFDAEQKPRLKHEKLGTLSMVNNGNNMNGSQFFLTLGENITYLDEVHTVFGEVAEGFETLLKINEAICDPNNRPYQDIRITHTVVLHDPYDDPAGLEIPDMSPIPTKEQLESNYIGADEEIDDTKGKDVGEIEEKIKESEAKARATILEMVGDIPDADVKPPENVLFVCKLNPVTTSEDLEIIFSRFGTIVSCEVIKDKKSGESLQYAFIEFEKEEDCENAYFKMDNVLIDDRRIHVDFSQSVSKLNWDMENKPIGKGFRPQNFSIKGSEKKSDGYEMIFDMNSESSSLKAKKFKKSRSPDPRYKHQNVGGNTKERDFGRSHRDKDYHSKDMQQHGNYQDHTTRKKKDSFDTSKFLSGRNKVRKNLSSRSPSPEQRAPKKTSESRRRRSSSDSSASEKFQKKFASKEYSKKTQRHDSSSSEDAAGVTKLESKKYPAKSSDSAKQALDQKSHRNSSPVLNCDKRKQSYSGRRRSRSSGSSSPKRRMEDYRSRKSRSTDRHRDRYGDSLSTRHRSRSSSSPVPKQRTMQDSHSRKSRPTDKHGSLFTRQRSRSSGSPSPKRKTVEDSRSRKSRPTDDGFHSARQRSRSSGSSSPKRRTVEDSRSRKSRPTDDGFYSTRHRSRSSESPSPKRKRTQQSLRKSRSPDKPRDKRRTLRQASPYARSCSKSPESSTKKTAKSKKASYSRTSNSPERVPKNSYKLVSSESKKKHSHKKHKHHKRSSS